MAIKSGNFVKAAGGDFGAFWQGGRWHRFDCIGCMYAQKILKPTDRLQGRALPVRFTQMEVEYRHDSATHAAWLSAGKPTDDNPIIELTPTTPEPKPEITINEISHTYFGGYNIRFEGDGVYAYSHFWGYYVRMLDMEMTEHYAKKGTLQYITKADISHRD